MSKGLIRHDYWIICVKSNVGVTNILWSCLNIELGDVYHEGIDRYGIFYRILSLLPSCSKAFHSSHQTVLYMCSCVSFLIDRKLIKGIYGVCLSHPYTVLRFWPLHVATRPMTTKLHIHRDGPREVDMKSYLSARATVPFSSEILCSNSSSYLSERQHWWVVEIMISRVRMPGFKSWLSLSPSLCDLG